MVHIVLEITFLKLRYPKRVTGRLPLCSIIALGVTYYISLYVGAKRLIFHLSPRHGHVINVSGCLILTAVNLIILIRQASVKLCKIYCDI